MSKIIDIIRLMDYNIYVKNYCVGGIFLDDYLSLKEIAEKWSISQRRLQILCNENRITGAMKISRMWFIPNSTSKPADARIKSGKYIKNKINKQVRFI